MTWAVSRASLAACSPVLVMSLVQPDGDFAKKQLVPRPNLNLEVS
jgi:hypothetical protein